MVPLMPTLVTSGHKLVDTDSNIMMFHIEKYLQKLDLCATVLFRPKMTFRNIFFHYI